MKKITLIALATAAATMFSSLPANSSDGQFHFRGQITLSPCGVIVPNGGYVQMQEWAVKELTSAAATTAGARTKSFNIQLVDCDTAATAKTVTATFTGPTVGTNGVFAVSSLGNDAMFGGDTRAKDTPTVAQGVGLRLFDADGSKLDAGVKSATAQTFGTGMTLAFLAGYVYTGADTTTVKSGYADADIDFTLNYL